MQEKTLKVITFLGPFSILIGAIMLALLISSWNDGIIMFGPKFGPKEKIEKTKDPERFNSIVFTGMILASGPFAAGIGITIYVFQRSKRDRRLNSHKSDK